MDNDLLESHKSKLMQLAFGLGFLVLVLVAVKMLMAGNYSKIGAIIGLLAGVGTVLALDRYYWLLCPFFFMFSFDFPGPFDGPELGMLSVVTIHFFRVAFHKENAFVFDTKILAALPMFLWIAIIWCMNPAGLAILGSKTIGLRFYIKLALAFLTLLSLSTIRLEEKDCKILFRLLFVTAVLSSIITAFFTPILSDPSVAGMGMDGESFTAYRFSSFGTPFGLLFSRWSLVPILLSPWKFLFAIACAFFVVLSGKRLSFGFVMIVPVLRSFLSRQNILATIVSVLVGFFVLVFAVAGDGSLYRLPKSATRCLAVVFPKYRSTYTEGINDTFRTHMREQAWMVVRENPWFGRKGFSMSYQDVAWMSARVWDGPYSGHAFVGNWHTTWPGMSADYGIPGAVLWALFYLYLIVFIFKINKGQVQGSYRQTCCLWYSLSILNHIVFSHFYGHSALTPQSVWVDYGMLLAIVNSRMGRWFTT